MATWSIGRWRKIAPWQSDKAEEAGRELVRSFLSLPSINKLLYLTPEEGRVTSDEELVGKRVGNWEAGEGGGS
eukprot:2738460-Pleurochrysis_carterae.AAC.1